MPSQDKPLNIKVTRLGGGDYVSHASRPINDIFGGTLGNVQLAHTERIFDDTRPDKIRPLLEKVRGQGLSNALKKLAAAADIFERQEVEIGGILLAPEEYARYQSKVTGATYSDCLLNMKKIGNAMRNAEAILRGHLKSWRPDLTLEQVFEKTDLQGVRLQSDLMAMILPSNSPGVHQVWAPAIPILPLLAKPGSGDLLSPVRMRKACEMAGLDVSGFGIYPAEGATVAGVINEASTRKLIFGGDQTVKRFANSSEWEIHRSGYSKFVFGHDKSGDWENFKAQMLEGITANSGRGCINTSVIVISEEHAEPLARWLASEFAAMKLISPLETDATLAAFTSANGAEATFERIQKHTRMGGGRLITPNDEGQILKAPGYSILRPSVSLFNQRVKGEWDAAHFEYPLPAVAIIAVPKNGKISDYIGHSLVCTVITDDAGLKDELSTFKKQGHISRLNFDAIPTTHIHHGGSHAPIEGNGIMEFLFNDRGDHPEQKAEARAKAEAEKLASIPAEKRAREAAAALAAEETRKFIASLTLPSHAQTTEQIRMTARIAAANRELDLQVERMMRYHFSPETGSPYWLAMREKLGFDPIKEVKTFDDLVAAFPIMDPNVLKVGHSKHLIPAAKKGVVYKQYQTGGTSGGTPSRRPSWSDYQRDYEAFSRVLDLTPENFPYGANWLMAGPSGPRRLPDAIPHLANFRGGTCLSIDCDPVNLKRLIKAGHHAAANIMRDNIVKDIVDNIKTGEYQVLFTSPPLLAEITRRINIQDYGIKGVFFGGTEIEPEYLRVIQERVGPGVMLRPTYGNTLMGLAVNRREMLTQENGFRVIYQEPRPFSVVRLVDPANPDKLVPYGQWGRVELTTMTEEFLVVRYLERDQAIRVKPTSDDPWDGIEGLKGWSEDGEQAVTGVY